MRRVIIDRPSLLLGLALSLLVLSALPVSASPWLQGSYDAARTGNVGGTAPAHADVAFRVQLLGTPAFSELLIAKGSVYVATVNTTWFWGEGDPEGFQGIVRVDLDTGEAERFAALEEPPIALTSDGETILAFQPDAVTAVSLDEGKLLWTRQVPAVRPVPDGQGVEMIRTCPWSPATVDGWVFSTCVEVARERASGRVLTVHEFVWSLDVGNGETVWTWVRDDDRSLPDLDRPLGGALDDPTEPSILSRTSATSFPGGATVAGSHVTMPLMEFHGLEGREASMVEIQFELFSLDQETGELEWARNTSATRSWHATDPTDQTGGIDETQSQQSYSWSPAADARSLYTIEGSKAVALNPGQEGAVLWSQPIGQEDPDMLFGSALPALDDEAVYLTSAQTLYRFDRATGSVGWSHTLDAERAERFPMVSLVLTDDHILALTAPTPDGQPVEEQTSSLLAFDKATGALAWRYETPQAGPEAEAAPDHVFGLAEGVVALRSTDGTLTVLGQTAASLQPRSEVSQRFPDPGETVEVDLSPTGPGIGGQASEYRVDWGDGTATDWSADPRFEYAYGEAGDVEALFQVRNDAGQTATQTHTFRVGHSEPNVLETAFARENQDLTFGILGIALAIGGGAVGVTQRHRRRTRLQDELGAVERAFEETRDRPAECEAQLTERRTHARGLLLDGQIDEEQFRVIEGRIEELAQELRLAAVEAFDFLPHRLLRSLRVVVSDGEVTEMEKAGFLAKLEEDELLTGEYKERVRAKIEEWYQRDQRR